MPTERHPRRVSQTKQKVTFRVDPMLADALRELPNQTAFVERVLRDALGRTCPMCAGTGEVPDVHLAVSDLKRLGVPRLDRAAAAQLKALVRLGRELLATGLDLEPDGDAEHLSFRLTRANQTLLSGTLPRGTEPGPQIRH